MTDNSANQFNGNANADRLIGVPVSELKDRLGETLISPEQMQQIAQAILVGPVEGLSRPEARIDKIGNRKDADNTRFSIEVIPENPAAQIYMPGKNAPSRSIYQQAGKDMITTTMRSVATVMQHLEHPELGGTKNVPAAKRNPELTQQRNYLARLAIDLALVELTEGEDAIIDNSDYFADYSAGIYAVAEFICPDLLAGTEHALRFLVDRSKQLILAAEELAA